MTLSAEEMADKEDLTHREYVSNMDNVIVLGS
jgi:hypothetical protein